MATSGIASSGWPNKPKFKNVARAESQMLLPGGALPGMNDGEE